ncbi:MAG: PHP domain-containing protein [Bacteroidales bacterium]
MKNKHIVILTLVLIVIAGIFFSFRIQSMAVFNQKVSVEWVSPYKDIDWESAILAKAQFHSHTTESDGELSSTELIELYIQAGFDILAITDHWKSTWPWEDYVVDDIKHEILAIQGAEPSHRGKSEHHMVSLFSNISGYEMQFEETLTAIESLKGLATFAHPARSTERNNNELDDYIYYFDKFSHIYGIDIFTRATFREPERWEIGKKLISDLLMHYGSPRSSGWRPIWLTSTDDLHSIDHLNQGFQLQVIDELNQENVYRSLKNGCFFWVANGEGENNPIIESISFDDISVQVKGNGFDHIKWYFNNEVVHSGEILNAINDIDEDVFYVYFTAYTDDFSVEGKTGSLIGSQPFWIIRE